MSTATPSDAGQEPERFSARLKAATWSHHEAAENHGFTDDLLAGRLPRAGYTAMVAQHYFAYSALEDVGRRLADDPVAGPFVLPALYRVPALEHDLELLAGPGWRERITPSPATRAYVERIRCTAEWPAGHVAHHYTRYIGDLSGGQFIGKAAASAYGLTGGAGTAFYDFGALGSLPRFKERYRTLLDGLGADEAERARVVDEARLAYRLNIDVLADLGRAHAAGSAA